MFDLLFGDIFFSMESSHPVEFGDVGRLPLLWLKYNDIKQQ
jgi:hypothetical protein